MTIAKDRCQINLDPFLSDFLYKRDEMFRVHDVSQEIEWGLYGGTEKRFFMRPFFEAFLGTYTSRQLTDFLETHLDPSNESKLILNEIKNIENDYRICFPFFYSKGQSKSKLHVKLYGVNFDVREIDKYVLKSFRPDCDPSEYQEIKGLRHDMQDKTYIGGQPIKIKCLGKVKTKIHKLKPKILIMPHLNGPINLDNSSIVKHYPKSYTQGLRLIKGGA